jgi:hypothetical protein
MSNLLSDIKRGKDSFSQKNSLDISKKLIQNSTTVVFKENVWLTNKDNESLNSFQAELNYLPEVVDFDTVKDLSAIKMFLLTSVILN